MSDKSCFFIGNREATEELLPLLTEAIEPHITKYGVLTFIVGGYGGFDRIASMALAEAKRLHPEINLLRLIAYHPAERPIDLPDGFDRTFYPPGMEMIPRKVSIVKANRFTVEHVDYLIAYAWHPASNARELLEYAQKRSQKGLIKVENLYDAKDR